MRRWLWLFLCFPLLGVAQGTLNVNEDGSYTFKLLLSKFVVHRAFTLTEPNRVVIDLESSTLNPKLSSIPLQNTPVHRIRCGHFTPQIYRIVLDVDVPMRARSDWHEGALWVNFKPKCGQKIIQKPPPVKTKPINPMMAINTAPKIFHVVIDPGHGGKDPGATGAHGIQEKDIALSIAKRLASILSREPRTQVYLTRNHDQFLKLNTRLKLAHRDNADCLISIHADACPGVVSPGSSVYILSPHGASSASAKWLADKENFDELKGKQAAHKKEILRTVLFNVSQTATLAESLKLGKSILGQLRQVTNVHCGKVEQAGFMVLKSPDIPSVLIETGFISNPTEESRLTNPQYQQKLAVAIANGIRK